MSEVREPHVVRMVHELTELKTKIEALKIFNAGSVYLTLPELDRNLLEQQLIYMEAYAMILNQRYDLATLP